MANSADFERQVATILDRGLAKAAGLADDEFRDLAAPLAAQADGCFAIVVRSPAVAAIEAVDLKGRAGFTSMEADDLARFRPLPDLNVPEAPVYLATGLDSGGDTRGVRPQEALPVLAARGRSPLTLEEGLALALHHPDVLVEQNCYQMAGSRCGDKRLTGVWLSAKRPRLGWCWMGNPHSWLGAGSLETRISLGG